MAASTYNSGAQFGVAIQTQLDALIASMPVPSTATPSSEATSGTAGTDVTKYAQEGHQHPRLTSTTYATVAAGSTVSISFTRSFTNKPGMVFTEIEGDSTATSQPATFKVQSWVQDANSKYIGCVAKIWRAQTVPQNLISLLAAAAYSIFGSSVVGTQFSCVAIARSDVTQ